MVNVRVVASAPLMRKLSAGCALERGSRGVELGSEAVVLTGAVGRGKGSMSASAGVGGASCSPCVD